MVRKIPMDDDDDSDNGTANASLPPLDPESEAGESEQEDDDDAGVYGSGDEDSEEDEDDEDEEQALLDKLEERACKYGDALSQFDTIRDKMLRDRRAREMGEPERKPVAFHERAIARQRALVHTRFKKWRETNKALAKMRSGTA